jgi:hypothetical protein
MLVTLPRAQLDTAWFVGLLTLGNTGVLLATVVNGTSTELWMLGAVVLLLAMASYAPSILHFSLPSSLVIGGYGVTLHRSMLLQTDEVLFLPALLCLALVFVSKITTTQAEIQRVVDREDSTPNKSLCDPLTGLPQPWAISQASRAYRSVWPIPSQLPLCHHVCGLRWLQTHQCPPWA